MSTPDDVPQGFAMIPRSMLHDPEVPGDAKWVYLALSSHAGGNHMAWPSHKRIADMVDRSISQVKRMLHWLETHGYIAIEPQYADSKVQRTNAYTLLVGNAPSPAKTRGPARTPTRSGGTPRGSGGTGEGFRENRGRGSGVATNDSHLERESMNEQTLAAADADGGEPAVLFAVEADPEPERKARARDELFEAMVEVCGINAAELTDAQRGSLNGSLRQLRQVGATPEQVRTRAGRYREQMPAARLTPPALAKHWATLGDYPAGLAVGSPKQGRVVNHAAGTYVGTDGVSRSVPPSGRFQVD